MLYSEYLKKQRKCPFCNLFKEEIFASNNSADLILSRAPYTKNHMLVVPRKHKRFMWQLTPKEKRNIDKLVMRAIDLLHKKHKNVSMLYKEGIKKEVGKSISHMHFHIIPDMQISFVDANLNERKFYSEEDYLKRIEKLKQELK
jgi:histidine triad (HIT) family protein